jgi:hypothetical protein
MSPLFKLSLVKKSHAYTSSKEPWEMATNTSVSVRAPDGRVLGWKLFHYLSGGGIAEFAYISGRSAAIRKQVRFLTVMAVVAIAWLIFFFV